MNIIRDILHGRRQPAEWPRFILWAVGKTFWLWAVIIAIGGALLLME